MIDKFSEYRLVSGRSVMPAGEKHTVLVKKVALRELPNESGNIINSPPENSPMHKEKGLNLDSIKVLGPDSVRLAGSKRQQSDVPASPLSCQMPGKIGPHGNLVYVRRRLETEQAKTGSAGNTNKVESPASRKSNNISVEPDLDLNQIQEPKTASLPAYVPDLAASLVISSGEPSKLQSNENTNSGLAVPEPHDSNLVSTTPVVGDSHEVNNQDWKERFLQLQMFLKSCDQSSQEDYMQMLQSLSAAGRSKHAVELETRAIHLMLEESKEMHRMKVLNVLGKASQKDHVVLPTHTPSPLQSHFQR